MHKNLNTKPNISRSNKSHKREAVCSRFQAPHHELRIHNVQWI